MALKKKVKKNKVCGFILKLIGLLNDQSNRQIIDWGLTPHEFIIRDISQFASKLAPTIFKHHNYSSFIRQLNIYGFTKSKNGQHTYEHVHLDRNDSSTLHLIQRKNQKKDENETQKKQERIQLDQWIDIKLKYQELKNNFHQLKSQNKKLKYQQRQMRDQLTQLKGSFYSCVKGIATDMAKDVHNESEFEKRSNSQSDDLNINTTKSTIKTTQGQNYKFQQLFQKVMNEKAFVYDQIKFLANQYVKGRKESTIDESHKRSFQSEKSSSRSQSQQISINYQKSSSGDIGKFLN